MNDKTKGKLFAVLGLLFTCIGIGAWFYPEWGKQIEPVAWWMMVGAIYITSGGPYKS